MAMLLGLLEPSGGTIRILGEPMAAAAPARAAADELHQPLSRPAAAADRAPEPAHLLRPLFGRPTQPAHRRACPRPRPHCVPGPPVRPPVGRPEDPRAAGQGADQRARAAAARRAHGLARPRHRRPAARPSRALPGPHPRHRAAGLAQHGRGRAAGPPRADAPAGPFWSTRAAPPSFWPATAATTWKTSFSTLPATAAARWSRWAHDEPGPATALAPYPRHAAPARLPAAGLVAAPARSRLLAYRADDPVGLHHPVPGRPVRLGRPGRRGLPLGRPALGYPLPRPARRVDVLPRGDVRPPSRPPVRQPVAAVGAGGRQLHDQCHARDDRRGRCRDPGLPDFFTTRCWARWAGPSSRSSR